MKHIKKIGCLILSVLLVISVAMPAFAAADTNVCPTVHINGIMSSRLYADKDDSSTIMPLPEADDLTAIIKEKLFPALLNYCITQDIDALAKVITDELNVMFKDYFNNPDGTPVGNSGVKLNYPSASSIKMNSKLQFAYDWRGDPFVIAAELNDYINYILDSTGSDKVALTCHSLGSVVVTTYLSVYGDDKVSGIVFDTPAMQGVTYVGDLLCGEICMDAQGVMTFLESVLGEAETEKLVKEGLAVLNLGPVPELFIGFLDDVLQKLAPTGFKETLIPMFSRWLTIWALTPDNRVEEAMEYLFGDATDEDTLILKSKIESYNEIVRKNRTENLLKFDEKGKLAVISRYGYSSLPLTSSWENLSDTVMDVKYNSLGATTVKAGEHFSDEYLAGKDMKYISPDLTVDASTCLFPEKTWFIKKLEHSKNSALYDYYPLFLFSDEEVTCDNFALTRFSVYDAQTKEVSADKVVHEAEKEPAPMNKILRFLTSLLDFFRKLFSGFKK